ncbi:MAG: hypothetical protein GXO35_04200 [Gammaproteobacteria bacterium]|nr:hypothetical protein [Gammaproteobacteria bacterium]
MQFEIAGVQFNLSENEPFVSEEFDRLSLEFFDRSNGDPALHDRYYNNLAWLINRFFQRELWHKAEMYWSRILRPALEWEAKNPGRFIHKGTPYYFWGMASISRGELDMGYLLMHQALQEDIRTHNNERPNTPAFAFATFDFTKIDQAFRIWPEYQARFLEQFLQVYRQSYAKTLSIEDFRNRFLVSSSNLDTIFLFAYSLGRLFLFGRVPGYAKQSIFTSQIESNMLFDVLLVVDAAIKVHNPNQRYFREHALFLSGQANLGLNPQKLQEINQSFNTDPNLSIVGDILDGVFRFSDGAPLTGLASDVALSYGLRNYGAHNIASVLVVRQRFDQIQQSLFNVLFLAVDELY